MNAHLCICSKYSIRYLVVRFLYAHIIWSWIFVSFKYTSFILLISILASLVVLILTLCNCQLSWLYKMESWPGNRDAQANVLSQLPTRELLGLESVSKDCCRFVSDLMSESLFIQQHSKRKNQFLVSFSRKVSKGVMMTSNLLATLLPERKGAKSFSLDKLNWVLLHIDDD